MSIRADKVYIQALRSIASARGVLVGDLVREAIDAAHGAALQPYISFFAQTEQQIRHSAKASAKR